MKSVKNMESGRGNFVPNQFIISGDGEIIFQSYNSIIAVKRGGSVILDRDKWDYSKTIGKYRNQFLGEDKKATEKKIADGTYTLQDLNQ
jgi:hypothetical protein